MTKLFAALFSCIAACSWTMASADAQTRVPLGYFVMQELDTQNVKDVKLASPVFTGIVIRQRWSTINPAPNTFNWKFLDQQTARARRLGKRYIIAIYTGNNAPGWLGVPLYKSAPLPWDEAMLNAHGQMVMALGQRYGADPSLVGVEIGGPTRGPSGSLEMHLADGLVNYPGYSAERVALAWIRCIDQYGTAFRQCALISDGGVAPGGKDVSITQSAFDYLAQRYPMQAQFSHCALKANTLETAPHHQVVLGMARRGCAVGFEMVGPSVAGTDGQNGPVARFGGSFSSALLIANRAGARWLKIYQGDEFNALSPY
jgi:hypothetical protein